MNKRSQQAAADLIYLVACALNETPPDAQRCAAMDLEAVYYMAQAHSMTAAAAVSLEQVTELPHAFDQALKKAMRKLALFDIERSRILQELEKDNIGYLPLKGVVLRGFYPKAVMRQMSDNDILCDSEKMDAVKTVMERLGYTCLFYKEYNHDTYTKPPTLEFEMHRALFPDDILPEYAEYYRDIRDRLLRCEGTRCGYRMRDEDFYAYLIAHMYKHHTIAGTGLRSLADVYVFCKSRYASLRQDYLADELRKLHLTDYERQMRLLSQKVFTAQPLDREESRMLAYQMQSGTYGSVDHQQYNLMNKRLGGDDSRQAKRRYLLQRVFIGGKDLEEAYPFFYRHKALYPLLFIYRPVKGVITHPRSIIGEYKRLRAFRKKEK